MVLRGTRRAGKLRHYLAVDILGEFGMLAPLGSFTRLGPATHCGSYRRLGSIRTQVRKKDIYPNKSPVDSGTGLQNLSTFKMEKIVNL